MINKKNVFGVEPLSKKIIESTSEVVDEDELIIWNTKTINEITRRIRRGERIKERVPFLEGIPDYRKAGTLFEYTQQELDEYMKCKNDVIYFAENYCYIINSGKKFKIPLRDYQRRILRDFQSYPFHILLASRQIGKTTLVSIFLSWYGMFYNNRTILATAHIASGMHQTLRNIRMVYDNLPFFLKPGSYGTAVTSLTWDNGSRIIGATTTENTGRSIPVNLLYADEFAFVKQSIAEKFYGSLYPTLSAQEDGRFIITSTINGINTFSKIFVSAMNHENRFHAHQVDWWEVPGHDEKWKQDQINDLGSVEKFEQEYGNKIYNDAESIIDAKTSNLLKRVKKNYTKNQDEYLTSMVSEDWLANLKILPGYDFTNKNNYYVVSIDFADGYGQDYTVAQIFEISLNSRAQIVNPEYHAVQSSDLFGFKQVALWRDNRTDLDDFSKGMSKFLFNYLKPENTVLVVEANDFRWNILDNILKMNPKFKDYIYLKTKHKKDAKQSRIGVRLNGANKKYYFNLMKRYINNKRIKIFEEDTVTEFLSFGVDKEGRYVSQTGHDDAVMSVLNSVAFFDSTLFVEFCDDIIQAKYKHTFKKFQALLSKKNKNDSITSLYKVTAGT